MKVSKKWWKFRIAFWIVGFIVLTYFLIQYTPWHKFFETAHERNLKASYKASIVPGQPLVEAIYRFKNEFGIWPDDLRDLKALKNPPEIPDGWYLLYRGKAPQVNLSKPDGSRVGYNFDGDDVGWRGWSATDNRPLDIKQTVPATTEPPEKIYERVLAGLDRKLQADSDLPENWQNKGGYLHAFGKTAELEEFLNQARLMRSNSYWPFMASAVLEAEKAGLINNKGRPTRNNAGAVLALLPEKVSAITSSSTTTAPAAAPATSTAPAVTASAIGPHGAAFIAWVVAHPPSMTHYFYVYSYARMIGDNPGALRAAELATEYMGRKVDPNFPIYIEGMKEPIARDKPVNNHLVETADDDLHTRYFYMYRLARFAYEMRDDALVLDVCARWSAGDEGIKNRNYSFLPLAAAANLSMGNFDRAESLANDAGVLSSRDKIVWAQNLDPLEKATKAKNRAYIYVPNPDGSAPEYDVWKIFYQ